jgi:hypothetical protein
MFFIKYSQDDEIKVEELEKACSMHGKEIYVGFRWTGLTERDHWKI